MKNIIDLFNQKDKLQHILVVLIIYQLSYIVLNKFINIFLSILFAIFISGIVIIGKEIYDKYISKIGVFDINDIYAGIIGILIGLVETIILII